MRLQDLAERRPFEKPAAVPDWTLGCFRRRCITYATGQEDSDTQVIWVQSNGLTADIRIPRERPALLRRQSLEDCTREELMEFAKAEGFIARTAWREGFMYWNAIASFQPYDKWPEPGRLTRIGANLIEFAPSGIYVEDWRLQRQVNDLAIGLKLRTETGLDGVERARNGGLVVAGHHAVMMLGRRQDIPEGRAQDFIANAKSHKDAARAVFDAEVAYAIRQDDDYRIMLAVDPFANGQSLFLADGFEPGRADDEVVQLPAPHETFSERRWKVDTLLTGQTRIGATPSTLEGLEWLRRESDTLLRRT